MSITGLTGSFGFGIMSLPFIGTPYDSHPRRFGEEQYKICTRNARTMNRCEYCDIPHVHSVKVLIKHLGVDNEWLEYTEHVYECPDMNMPLKIIQDFLNDDDLSSALVSTMI